MVKKLDCDLKESMFDIQSLYYVRFHTNGLRKAIEHLLSIPVIGLILFFCKVFLGIKYSKKGWFPLNKDTEIEPKESLVTFIVATYNYARNL